MEPIKSINVRQPAPHDIVGQEFTVCGIGEAWEGATYARITDSTGAVLAEENFTTSMGQLVEFHVTIRLNGVPGTAAGVLEVFGDTALDDSELGPEGREVDKVVVPLVFGAALLPDYAGFSLHHVQAGETLTAIAGHWNEEGGDPSLIFEANRDLLEDPDVIRPGQVLRIPM